MQAVGQYLGAIHVDTSDASGPKLVMSASAGKSMDDACAKDVISRYNDADDHAHGEYHN